MKYKVIYHKFYKSRWFYPEIICERSKKFIIKAHSPKECLSEFMKRFNDEYVTIDVIMEMRTSKKYGIYEIINNTFK